MPRHPPHESDIKKGKYERELPNETWDYEMKTYTEPFLIFSISAFCRPLLHLQFFGRKTCSLMYPLEFKNNVEYDTTDGFDRCYKY